MTRWRTRHRGLRSDRGAAAVEFAIVLVVLLLIIFAIIDFGRLLYVKQSVASASREGARVGVVKTATSGTIVDRTRSAADAARALAGASATSVEGATCTTAPCTATSFSPSNTGGWAATTGTPTSTTPCAGTNQALRVTVSVPFSWFTPVGIFASSVNRVDASTTMRCE